MLVLDCKKEGWQNNYKQWFLPPPACEDETGEKKREAGGRKKMSFYTVFWGP